MRKRIPSTLLALCMVLVLLQGAAQAAGAPQSGTYGDLTWEYNNGTLTISGKGDMPYSTGFPEIPWSSLKQYVSKVVIEDGVTNIGYRAFFAFENLTDVDIPNSVTTISDSAFRWCSSLTRITIPNSVTAIGMQAFDSCYELTSITIPGSVNMIESRTFIDCANLAEVTIQEGVKYIESDAFGRCINLTRVSIPASVIRITTPFGGCSSLTEITVDSKNTEYSSQDGALFTKEKDTILTCPQGKTAFTIPTSVNTIGGYAFADCSKLTAVTIPNSVNTIGDSAFRGCTRLGAITIPDSVNSIGISAFGGCIALAKVNFPSKLSNKNYNDRLPSTFNGCTSLTEITIPEGIAEIGGTFSGCTNLETIHLPVSLTRISSGTFFNCLKIKSIVYSGTETQWGQIFIDTGNAELKEANFTFLNQSEPSTPDTPDTPDTPTTPGTLSLTVTNGGLGKKVTVKIESGHWLTVQTRRGGSISVTSIQAPADASGMASVTISASAGSVLQIWETETEMQFSNGVPTTPILNTATRSL